jgi:hypothetical protein
VLSVQDEISRGIVNSLRLKLGRGRRRYDTNPDAYDLYLRARALAFRRFRGDPEISDLYEKAIAKDPSLAPAYAGLAAAYAVQSFTRPNSPQSRGNIIENARGAGGGDSVGPSARRSAQRFGDSICP